MYSSWIIFIFLHISIYNTIFRIPIRMAKYLTHFQLLQILQQLEKALARLQYIHIENINVAAMINPLIFQPMPAVLPCYPQHSLAHT